jgi:hypothetical protein
VGPEQQFSSDFSLTKLIPAVLGSLVSLRFVQGTWPERLLMAAGGAGMSYYATVPSAAWLQVQDAEGLVGFLIGLFGMAVVAKAYETFQALDAKMVAADLWAEVKKRFGIGK